MIFDGNNYTLWINGMKTNVLDLGVDVCLFIVNGYKSPKTPPTDLDEKKSCSCNYKERPNILNALSPTIQDKVICATQPKKSVINSRIFMKMMRKSSKSKSNYIKQSLKI